MLHIKMDYYSLAAFAWLIIGAILLVWWMIKNRDTELVHIIRDTIVFVVCIICSIAAVTQAAVFFKVVPPV